ncbi:MAG: hypothetical protein ACYTFW_18660 [Planctomycetota bacterium]
MAIKPGWLRIFCRAVLMTYNLPLTEGRRMHRCNSNDRGITFGLTRLDSWIYW